MKWMVILGVLAAVFTYMMVHTMDVVFTQTQHLQATYQNISDNADKIVNGH